PGVAGRSLARSGGSESSAASDRWGRVALGPDVAALVPVASRPEEGVEAALRPLRLVTLVARRATSPVVCATVEERERPSGPRQAPAAVGAQAAGQQRGGALGAEVDDQAAQGRFGDHHRGALVADPFEDALAVLLPVVGLVADVEREDDDLNVDRRAALQELGVVVGADRMVLDLADQAGLLGGFHRR